MANIRIVRVAVDAMILPFCFPDKSNSLALYGTNSNTVPAMTRYCPCKEVSPSLSNTRKTSKGEPRCGVLSIA
jgi:hypothetical protein